MRDHEELELASKVLDSIKERFSDVAVQVVRRRYVMIKLWNGEPSVTQSWVVTNVNIYVARNSRVFVTTLNVGSLEGVREAVSRIDKAIEKLEPSEVYAPLPKPSGYARIEGMYDPRVVDAMNNPGRYVELMVSPALSEGVERVAGTLTLGRSVEALVTSAGFSGVQEGTEVEAYLRAFKNGVSGHWALGSRSLDVNALKEVGRRAARYALITSSKAEFTPGRYDVILSPLVVGNLMNVLSFMASAMAVLLGFSMFMKYKPGDRVGSDAVTLIDAPRDAELPGSTAFDDEGVETRDKAIIERGIFKTLLHNAGTAKKLGGELTGNAGWVMPHAWNLHVGAGDIAGEEELIRELRNGILITNNWYTRLQNYVEGVFSTVSRDAVLLIRNGEVAGYVDRVRIADKFSNLLTNWRYSTRELYRIKWWEVGIPTKAPYVLVKNVNLTRPTI